MKKATVKKRARWDRQAQSLLSRAHTLCEEIEASVEEGSPLLEYVRAATIALDEFATKASPPFEEA
jgi:hypothetical protein